MDRTADYTILGFLYQFNKSVLAILEADEDDNVTVEGVVEDIEIQSQEGVTAIQCKYHEASGSFSPSVTYKPLLQMLGHYAEHPDSDYRYILFAHFGKEPDPIPEIGKPEVQAALASENQGLKKLIDAIPKTVDVGAFVDRFSMEFGPDYDTLVARVQRSLEGCGIPADDVPDLAYPNAVNRIANLSAKHEAVARTTTKRELVTHLKDIRTTAVTRWTLALKSRNQILQARRKQLRQGLGANARLRYFIIDPNGVSDFDQEIVLFVTDFLSKYHFKTTHKHTPVLCLCMDNVGVAKVCHRLYTKGVVATDGYIGTEFEEARFFREPIVNANRGKVIKREFHLRIISWDENGSVLNNRKCHDLFLVGQPRCDDLDTVDVNIESLSGLTMRELKYVMGVSDACD